VTGYGALRNRSQPPRVFSSVDGYRFGGYFGLTEDLEVRALNAAKRSSQELYISTQIPSNPECGTMGISSSITEFCHRILVTQGWWIFFCTATF
jgi:hypothetical protein